MDLTNLSNHSGFTIRPGNQQEAIHPRGHSLADQLFHSRAINFSPHPCRHRALINMAAESSLRRRARNISVPRIVPPMAPQRSRRPSTVDGKVLEPEWDLEPQTFGSFNQDALARISQAQAADTHTARPSTDISQVQSTSARYQLRNFSMDNPVSMSSQSPQRRMSSRYYSVVLSDEDRTALATGELNHNLKVWSDRDLVQHHTSRIELVPWTNKRQAAIAKILDEKRDSERLALKSARQAKRSVSSHFKKLGTVKETETHDVQARDEVVYSTPNFRAVSTPSLLLAPTSPPLRRSQEYFPVPIIESENNRWSIYSGISNRDDDFDIQSGHSTAVRSPSITESSQDLSLHRGRAPVRPPLVRRADHSASQLRMSRALDYPQYEPNPHVTFDSFLAPHISGKGETHRESVHARKEEEPRSLPRRLSKMASMPQLKKRTSEAFRLG